MAYREVLRLEIAEVVRRWQAGNSQRNIASGTGLSRDTVRKYLAAAREAGVVQEGPAPTEDQLNRRLASAAPAPGSLRGPQRTCWAPGQTRSTGGSTSTGYRSPASGSCWQPEGVRWPTRPCTGSSHAATGGAAAGARCGWERVSRGKLPNWTSGAWASSTTRRPAAAARCGPS